MKTIEEAAKEYSGRNEDKFSTFAHNFDKYDLESAFMKGVEFAQRWISVEEEMPEKLNIVLVKCNNKGKNYITTAQFIPKKTVIASDFLADDYEDECTEYDEEIDEYYVISGWWEYQTEVDINWKISNDVTHWRKIELL